MQLQLQRLVAASLLAPSIATMAIGDDDASPLAAALFPGICEDTATKELSAVRAVACPAGTQRVRVAGANIFDTLWVGSSGMNTCCNASGGPATYPDPRRGARECEHQRHSRLPILWVAVRRRHEGVGAGPNTFAIYVAIRSNRYFRALQVEQNSAVDIISIHHYENSDAQEWWRAGSISVKNCTKNFQSPGSDIIQ